MATIVAITCCNGELNESEKIFGFLKSANKCFKESNKEGCAKKSWTRFCDKVSSPLCECLDDNIITRYSTSIDEMNTCIKVKVQTYCAANAEELKCKMFERCNGSEEDLSNNKDCYKKFCEEPDHANAFDCLALACKENNSKPPQKLSCIKEACSSNGEATICQKISACEANNSGSVFPGLGKIKVFKCLITSVFGGLQGL